MAAIPAQLPDLALNQSGALGLLRRLENGALLTGRVQRPTTTGQTPVLVGSTTLPLVLPETLAPGTLVTLRSQGGRILVEPQPNPTGQNPAASTKPPAGLALPLLSPESAPALMRALQSQQLPAQIETLQLIQSVLGQIAPDQIPILAFLLARNVPVTPETLAAIRDRLRARGSLGEEAAKLASGIDRLLASTSNLPPGLRDLLTQLKEHLFWKPQGSLSERVQSLREFLQSFEGKLLAGGSLQSDLKGMLLRLQSLISSGEFSVNPAFRENIQRVLNLIEGAQAAGLPPSAGASSEDWVFWRIPFLSDHHASTVEAAARGKRNPDNPDEFDLDNMEWIIQLTLEQLGPIRVRLLSRSDLLQLRFSVDRKESRPFILESLPSLVSVLEAQGFPSVAAEVRVEAVAEVSLLDELGPLREIERKTAAGGQPPPQFDVKL